MSRSFTREEFYELVWSKPMTHLAKEFGLSDVALHKICGKHGIPNPPLGWWAKHAAGHRVKRTPLPKLKGEMSYKIVIAGGESRQEPEAIASIRELARVRASEVDPARDVPVHPIVAKSIEKLRSARPGSNGLVSLARNGLISLEIAPSSVARVELCLNRIVAAAETQGFKLSGKGERAAFEDGTLRILFCVKETVKRIKHVLTPEEIAEDEKRQRQRSRRWSRNERDDLDLTFGSRRPDWDYIPTGQLALEFDVSLRYASQVRRSFRDAKIQRLENMAPDVAVGLAVLAAAKADDDRRVEEARLREEETKRQRAEAQRQAHIEERRVKAFDQILERVERRDRLRRLIETLRQDLANGESPRVREFLVWAEIVLARAERSLSASGLEAFFEADRVFGPDDDHSFYPRPYGY